MDEPVSQAKIVNYSAIAETTKTEGFKKFEEMFKADINFAQSLLEKPKRAKSTSENPSPEATWITDPHAIGWARGILLTAKKYLNLAELSRTKNQA
jgi:hypothetical protein